MVVTELAEVSRRFFASNSASAKHSNLLVRVAQIFFDEFWELRERLSFGVDCTIECALDKFVVIAAVDECDIRVLNEGIPLLW